MDENKMDETTDCAARIDGMEEDIIRTLRELIAIRSVAGPAEEGAPFGLGVRDAFAYMLKQAETDGFATENVDQYGGHIEFGGLLTDADGAVVGLSDEVFGMLGHLDVVPEGSGWSCDPFAGKLEDGKIYGRGAIDDKGPLLACYFAMKALKQNGFSPQKRVRLILGLDEESGWVGMQRYLSNVKAPDAGFTPDADFPAIHGEMGILIFELAKKIGKSTVKGLELRKISGGNAANMTPDFARAVVRGEAYDAIREKIAEYRKETGYHVYAKGIGKSLEISAKGVSAHGATPEKGLNAISILMDFLSQTGLVNESVLEFIDFYKRHIGFDLHGDGIGCGFADAPSGKLIFNVGMVNGNHEAILLTINIRYPVTLGQEQIYDAMLPVIHKYDLGLVKRDHKAPIFIPADDPLIETLMRVYQEHTGDRSGKPLVIGGGTYARAAKNIVAFGGRFPGEPELAHQKDEFICVDSLIRMTKIYADAIYALAK
ncbi:MAG: dipeptidase PepV [Clostridiales Family XIII bacterium]|nr:dipeptidase PepV [Clostridiales Family XIII bacterium]